METSIFTEQTKSPTREALMNSLGKEMFELWNKIADFVKQQYPTAIEEWNYAGKNYGWIFRMKDKKRAIIYLLPINGFFKVALVFGQKATDQILDSNIANEIKTELKNARKYAEGRGIRITVKDASQLDDINELINIKLISSPRPT